MVDPGANGFQAGDDGRPLVLGDNTLADQHAGVGDGARDVVPVEPAVEFHRGSEGLDEGVGGLVEAPGPELAGSLLIAHSGYP